MMDHEPGQAVRDLIRTARRVATGEDGAVDALRALFNSPATARAIEKADREIRSDVERDLRHELQRSLMWLEDGPPGPDWDPEAHERLRARTKWLVKALRANLAELETEINMVPYPAPRERRGKKRIVGYGGIGRQRERMARWDAPEDPDENPSGGDPNDTG